MRSILILALLCVSAFAGYRNNCEGRGCEDEDEHWDEERWRNEDDNWHHEHASPRHGQHHPKTCVATFGIAATTIPTAPSTVVLTFTSLAFTPLTPICDDIVLGAGVFIREPGTLVISGVITFSGTNTTANITFAAIESIININGIALPGYPTNVVSYDYFPDFGSYNPFLGAVTIPSASTITVSVTSLNLGTSVTITGGYVEFTLFHH